MRIIPWWFGEIFLGKSHQKESFVLSREESEFTERLGKTFIRWFFILLFGIILPVQIMGIFAFRFHPRPLLIAVDFIVPVSLAALIAKRRVSRRYPDLSAKAEANAIARLSRHTA